MPDAGAGSAQRPAFCAADGAFRPGQAEGFGRWAKERLHFPPSAKLHEHLELRCESGGLGVHAVARRNYACGELVLSEDALIRIHEPARDTQLRLRSRFGERAAFLSPAFGVNWAAVSEDELRAALDLFYVHPSAAKPDSPQVESCLIACRDVIGGNETLKSRFQPLELLRLLHIVDLNIHKDDERPEMSEFTGIFVFGSKFSHSCASNCTWSFSAEGQLQYHTIRPIKAGELFTFSYIGNGMNLLTSTIDRRRRLSTLWFVCQCDRYTGPDLARRVRCPKCRADGACLPTYGKGTDTDGGRITSQGLPDADRWHCGACKVEVLSADMPMAIEAELAQLVPSAMMKARESESPSQEALQFERLRSRAAAAVGTQHWTYILAGFAWLQRVLAILKTEPIIVQTEADFHRVSAEVATWLRENAPNNAEQRMAALFAAVRLEHDLGGGLRAWGYDPVDPLGGGLQSVERLREHGWRISPDGCMVSDEDCKTAAEQAKAKMGL